MSITRDELFRRFGPFLTEAIARLALQYINETRQHVGLPKITYQQVLDDISNDINHLQPYDWMNEQGP